MEDTTHSVTSELYKEQNNSTAILPQFQNNTVSVYKFTLPYKTEVDEDGDLIVRQKSKTIQNIVIEHCQSTTLKQVGEQLWRGAFLLADWIIYNGDIIRKSGQIIELATGVGLTGIVGSIYTSIVLTDIDSGNILNLIQSNVERNKSISKYPLTVLELDFTKDFSKDLMDILPEVKLILAADVIYDDTLTEAFVRTLESILRICPKCKIIVALEKRFVFTIADLESCAPCLEYFKDCVSLSNDLQIRSLPIDFPQYFQYDRVKELVLYEISTNKKCDTI